MLLIINFLTNLIISLLLLLLVNYYKNSNLEKSIHFIQLSFSIKYIIYMLSAFFMAFYLSKFYFNYIFLIIPTLYMLFLLYIDSLIFFKTIKNIRNSEITILNYLKNIFKDSLLIFIPVMINIIIKNFFKPNNAILYLFITIFTILLYNLYYPYIVRFTLDSCKKDNKLSLFFTNNLSLDINFNIYVYNGKTCKNANAMICGIFNNYHIYISDYLIENMSSSELKSIIIHEIAHIKKHHLLIKNIILTSSVPLMITIGSLMDTWEDYFGKINRILGITLFLLILFIYSIIFLLYISRKQEYEADEFTVNKINKEIYINALTKLANLNLYTQKRTFIRELLSTHPSIENRINNLKNL